MPSRRNVDPIQEARNLIKQANVKTPPVPVEKLARSILGAELRFQPLDDELSGMIFIKDDVPIIGVNSLHHPNRQRFTLAHECAHLILHRDIISSEVHVDKQFPVLMRNPLSAAGSNEMEIQANQFAAELLMPKDMLEYALAGKTFDIDDEAPLEELARKFKVSKQALAFRIQNLK